jgi:pyruvate,water dikinase
LLAASLMPLNSTMIAVALPDIAREYTHSPGTVTQSLVSSYLVAAIVLQSPGGKLGDRLGHWRVFALGQALIATGAVLGFAALVQAVRQVHASGRDPGAQAYRARLGLERTSRMAVVVQELVDANVAGVLFTRNPVTGAAERVIEASWGLGEAVVSGLVTPDQYRLAATGRLLERSLGEKDLQIRRSASGGTEQAPVAPELIYAPCLGDAEVAALHALATACDRVFGSPDHDIEFAFRGGGVFLLQRRPITSG